MTTPTEAADLRRGTCVDAPNPDAWHPEEPDWATAYILGDTEGQMDAYERTAKDLCAGCPVRDECLTLALGEEADLPRSWIHGIRGGKAPWQRYQMRRYRRQATRKAVA